MHAWFQFYLQFYRRRIACRHCQRSSSPHHTLPAAGGGVAMAHHEPPQEADDIISSSTASTLPAMGDDFGVGHGGLSIEHGHGGTFSDDNSSSSTGNKQTSCLLPARSLRSTEPIKFIPAADQADGGVRSLSFSKILSFRMATKDQQLLQLEHDDDAAGAAKDKEKEKLKQVCRSQSVPTSVRRFSTAKGSRRVADSSSAQRLRVVPLVPPNPEPEGNKNDDEDPEEEEDIAAEEAVCRICMVALSESEEAEPVLKLECCCKGELALAHRACAIKWFGIKGNGTCDVCSQEVLNLPVTLRRLHDHPTVQAAATAAAALQQQAAGGDHPTSAASWNSSRRYSYRVWHGTPILVIISMLAYFCFLEQLLVGDHGTAALAISLPFACVLGLFSSLTTTKMVSRRYVWIYSAVQFLFIVLFTHLFYRYVRMQAVIAIILSTFAGFSITICTNSVLLQILRWRARHLASPTTATATAQGHASPVADPEIALPPA